MMSAPDPAAIVASWGAPPPPAALKQPARPAPVSAIPKHQPVAKIAPVPVKPALNDVDASILISMSKPRPPAKANIRQPFGLIRVSDLLRQPRPHDWIVKGYFEGDSLGLIFGDPAAGKSLLAMDWAARIATGTDWDGCRVKQGAVIYLAGEGHNGLSRRMKAWETETGISLEGAPFFVSTRRAGMPSEIDAVIAAADAAVVEHGVPALLVVDTLARHIDGDENAPVDMGLFIAACDGLRERYRCAVLIVHHSGHADKSRARAHSSLPGALDASYLLSNDAGGIRELSCKKAKDFEPPMVRHFAIKSVELLPPWVDEDGEPLNAPFLEAAAPVAKRQGKTPSGINQKLIWNALGEAFRKATSCPANAPDDLPAGRPCLELETAILAVKDTLTCEPARKAQRARQAIAGLISGGLLVTKNGFIWCA